METVFKEYGLWFSQRKYPWLKTCVILFIMFQVMGIPLLLIQLFADELIIGLLLITITIFIFSLMLLVWIISTIIAGRKIERFIVEKDIQGILYFKFNGRKINSRDIKKFKFYHYPWLLEILLKDEEVIGIQDIAYRATLDLEEIIKKNKMEFIREKGSVKTYEKYSENRSMLSKIRKKQDSAIL